MRLCDFPSAAPSFCDKFQEIYFGTNPAGRVSGYGSKSKNSDFVFTFRKGEKKESVSGSVQNARYNPVRFDKIAKNLITSTIQAILSAIQHLQQ